MTLLCTGSVTPTTWGALSASAMVAPTALAYCGSVIWWPSGATKTIWALVPAADGSSCLRVSIAVWAGEPGTLNSSSVVPPKVTTQVTTAVSTSSQAASTARR